MSNVSKKLARITALGLWSIASMALAGQAKTSAAAGCYENGKPVPTAKTQEECQKLGEKFTWMDAHEHGKNQAKSKGKVKQQAKTEAQPAKAVETSAPAGAEGQAETAAPASEAPKK